MHRNTDGTRLVCDGSSDRLSDPPGGIGTEFVALAVIKLFHCLDQTQIALLDQIQKKHPPPHISLGNTHHKTQIRLRKTLFRVGVTLFHLLCQLYFLVSRQQWHLADLFQIHADRILNAHPVGNRKFNIFQFLFRRLIVHIKDNIVVGVAVRNHRHDTILLKIIKNLFGLIAVQIDFLKLGVDITEFQDPVFLLTKLHKCI